MNKHNFCTLFDSNYLIKGLTMIESLYDHCPTAHIYILCLDIKTQKILEKLKITFITCIPLENIEDGKLLVAKKNRSQIEYFWTLSACFTWYVLKNYKSIDHITYLDSDLLFFSSVEPIFNEIESSSIAIIEHRFTPRFQNLVVNGKFCVEWVSFRRDKEGIECLTKWRDQCIEWCYYKIEDNRMADQKYLDEWPELYSKLHIIQHIGSGVAPWNYAQYEFSNDNSNNILVNGTNLIFYHFHQFQILSNGEFDRIAKSYTDESSVPELIYQVYESSIEDVLMRIREFDTNFSDGIKKVGKIKIFRFLQKYIPSFAKSFLRKIIFFRV